MKVVVNKCYGGFGLSPKAIKQYLERKGKECYFYIQTEYGFHIGQEDEYKRIDNPEEEQFSILYTFTEDLGETVNDINDRDSWFYAREVDRDDEELVGVVEELGEEANGPHANLQVKDIPDGINYVIDEYDGIETIREEHRSW